MDDSSVTAGSESIFSDLGLPDSEERLVKADRAIRIEELIAERRLTQSQAARVMGVSQPDISKIVRGRLKGFALERLLNCLLALDQSVEIRVLPRKPKDQRPRLLVSAS